MVEEKEGREGVYAETAPAAAERLKLEGAHTADGSAEMWATVRCGLRGWSRGEESSGMWGGLALRGWQVNEPPLPVFWCSNRWFASCGAACLIAPLWFLQPLLSDALLSGDTGERERAREEERERERERGVGGVGGVSARRALTLIHFHIYTPHVCMSRRRGRRRGKSLVKEWICAQRRASFFFFFSQSQSLVLTAEGNLPAPHPAPRTPERNMKPHSPAAHQVLSQTHTQAESWCVGEKMHET